MSLLDTKLKDVEKAALFYELFDFHYKDVSDNDEDPIFILYDENHEEYEGDFEFNTLKDFFDFAVLLSKEEGKKELKRNLNELLGLKH